MDVTSVKDGQPAAPSTKLGRQQTFVEIHPLLLLLLLISQNKTATRRTSPSKLSALSLSSSLGFGVSFPVNLFTLHTGLPSSQIDRRMIRRTGWLVAGQDQSYNKKRFLQPVFNDTSRLIIAPSLISLHLARETTSTTGQIKTKAETWTDELRGNTAITIDRHYYHKTSRAVRPSPTESRDIEAAMPSFSIVSAETWNGWPNWTTTATDDDNVLLDPGDTAAEGRGQKWMSTRGYKLDLYGNNVVWVWGPAQADVPPRSLN